MKINSPAPLFAVFVALAFASCSKDKGDPDAGGNTLAKIEFTSPNQATSFIQFNYDAQNRLIEINSSTGPKETFTYNAQGKLATYTVASILSYSYTYDANGRIIAKTGTPILVNLLVDDYVYTYDASGRVIADSVYTLGSLIGYSTYQYDNNNNVSGYQYFTKSGATFTTEGLITIQYDNKTGPYGQSGSLLFYTQGDYTYLSKANIVSQTRGQIVVMPSNYYTYKYYSNGLLRTRTNTSANGGTATFIYKQP